RHPHRDHDGRRRPPRRRMAPRPRRAHAGPVGRWPRAARRAARRGALPGPHARLRHGRQPIGGGDRDARAVPRGRRRRAVRLSASRDARALREPDAPSRRLIDEAVTRSAYPGGASGGGAPLSQCQRDKERAMRDEVDQILIESLLVGAAEALTETATELLELRRGWVEHDAPPHAVEWLDDLVARLGWWSGRLAAAAE